MSDLQVPKPILRQFFEHYESSQILSKLKFPEMDLEVLPQFARLRRTQKKLARDYVETKYREKKAIEVHNVITTLAVYICKMHMLDLEFNLEQGSMMNRMMFKRLTEEKIVVKAFIDSASENIKITYEEKNFKKPNNKFGKVLKWFHEKFRKDRTNTVLGDLIARKRKDIMDKKKEKKRNRFLPDAEPDEDKREMVLNSNILKKYLNVFEQKKCSQIQESQILNDDYKNLMDKRKQRRSTQLMKMCSIPLLKDLALKNDRRSNSPYKKVIRDTCDEQNEEQNNEEEYDDEANKFRKDLMYFFSLKTLGKTLKPKYLRKKR